MAKVEVFRLEHRKKRDPRLTTHVCLAARALGASMLHYSGERDLDLEKTVNDVTKNWGGPFKIKYVPTPKSFIKNFRGQKVHLTMYGVPFQKSCKLLAASRLEQSERRSKRSVERKPVLIIIGGPKVPGWIYQLADFNLSVTSQPHSEVAALAIFLYELFSRREKKFKGAKLEIVPQARGKKVVRKKR